MTRRKLLLINPVGRRSGYLMSRVSRFAPLGLAYVAALTPPDWQIEIRDENFDTWTFEEADLVGITAFTSNINRAYEIARQYRARQIPVVIGGIHASMTPDETAGQADAIVIGEAEGVWPALIADFEAGRMQTVYHGPRVDLQASTVLPRRDLLHPDYFWHSVQTSRGCPFNCNFCSVSRYMGKTYRQRTARDVLSELEGIPGRYISFVDDNLVGLSRESQGRAKALFRGMVERKLNKRWWMQTSINVAQDEEVVALAAKAGCMFVFIGFETIDGQALKTMHKGINLDTGVEHYKAVIRRFHRYGIGVLGAFILGNDHESRTYYEKLAGYMVRSGIDVFQISILTPLPGTRLMAALQSADNLIHNDFPADWEKYRFSYLVHRPQGVDRRSVYIGDNYIKKELYRFPNFQWRLLRSALALKSLPNFMVTYKLNQALKRSWQNSHYYQAYPHDFGGCTGAGDDPGDTGD